MGGDADPAAHRITARTKARRRAVEVLFEADQRGHYTPAGLSDLLTQRLALTAAQTALPQYSADIVAGVAAHLDQIEDVLLTYAQGRPVERMPAVDRAIARMATWELIYNDEVDGVVTVAEAVTIAADLSTDESPATLNALLDRLRLLGPGLRSDEPAPTDTPPTDTPPLDEWRAPEGADEF